MNYSNELIQYLKEKPFRNIDELIGKERFVEKGIDPLAKQFGYKYAKYSLLFIDGNFWGEIVEVYDLNGTLDFMVNVDANSKLAIAEECSTALGSSQKRMPSTSQTLVTTRASGAVPHSPLNLGSMSGRPWRTREATERESIRSRFSREELYSPETEEKP